MIPSREVGAEEFRSHIDQSFTLIDVTAGTCDCVAGITLAHKGRLFDLWAFACNDGTSDIVVETLDD